MIMMIFGKYNLIYCCVKTIMMQFFLVAIVSERKQIAFMADEKSLIQISHLITTINRLGKRNI